MSISGRGKRTGATNLQRKALRERKQAIDRGDNVEPTTQNSFYYFLRTIFLDNGIDPAKQGKGFRRNITNQIDKICNEFGSTREDLLIIADARATFYFRNEKYHVSLKNIQEKRLHLKGTDVIIIEKAALCDLLSPLAAKAGIALLDTKGYAVDYAKELTRSASEEYGNVAMITDFDTDGLLMAYDVYDKVSHDVYRIGVDLNTIAELRAMYPELNEELDKDKLQESYKPGFSLKRLKELARYGQLALYSRDQKKKSYVSDLEYLENHRIEIDSVQRATGYQKLWDFIIKKLEERFPERNYNRAIRIPQVKDVFPDIFLEFQKLLMEKMIPEGNILTSEIWASFWEYRGIKDDIIDDEIALKEYFKSEISRSNNLTDILDKIKDLIKHLREQSIQSFMKSTF
jgi:hypothetical protein